MFAISIFAETDSVKVQTKCPVSGEDIDKAVYLDAAGRRIYFADTLTRETFKSEAQERLPEIIKSDVEYEKLNVHSTFNRPACEKKATDETDKNKDKKHDYHSTTPACGAASHKGCGAATHKGCGK